jgi:hypothetical protein
MFEMHKRAWMQRLNCSCTCAVVTIPESSHEEMWVPSTLKVGEATVYNGMLENVLKFAWYGEAGGDKQDE